MAIMTKTPFLTEQDGGLKTIIANAREVPGTCFFVDSTHTNKSDAVGHGTNPETPFATLDYALQRCTANKGDLVLLMPGHAETLTADVDFDIAGVNVQGLGIGEMRPILTFGADVTLDVNAANCRLANVILKNDHDGQAVMVDVDGDDWVMEDCELREGSSKQAAIYIDLGEDRAKIRRCKITSVTAGAASGIKISAAKDGIEIVDCVIDGDFDDAAIHNPTSTTATNLLLKGNVARNRQTGDHAIELVSAVTGMAAGNFLFADTPGVVFDSGSLLCAANSEAHKIDAAGVPSPAGSTADEWVHVSKASATLPASTTQNLFTIAGGRVLVKMLVGEVTTVVQNQACTLKVSSVPTVGSAVDIASNLDINAFEAGGLLVVEGDGTALIGAAGGAGAANAANALPFILPIGTVRITTGATNTGATKWDVWYKPLDAGARMVSA